jgi:hypothetical protein
MAGLVPAIHVLSTGKVDVDARDMRGHDGEILRRFPTGTVGRNKRKRIAPLSISTTLGEAALCRDLARRILRKQSRSARARR